MAEEAAFLPRKYNSAVNGGTHSWSSPSNIALVKYWGKLPGQLPANPSISLTLNNCRTNTEVAFSNKQNDKRFSFDFKFEGESKADFHPKIEKFFERIFRFMPFIEDYHFSINSHNTFPHSSGIASSASSMAALSLCLMSIERGLDPEMGDEDFYKKASFLARLGSGSACRSISGSIVEWGTHSQIFGSSDLYGTKVTDNIHTEFNNFQDTILLVDKGEKQVSSTIGHDLMNGHPFAQRRFAQAHDNLSTLLAIFKSGDLDGFCELVESEALTLHAMMMTSTPHFILMKPNTLAIINKIAKFRKDKNIPACFTLDAGANVHILYPEKHKVQVLEFIKDELVGYCENGQYICDQTGSGSRLINNE